MKIAKAMGMLLMPAVVATGWQSATAADLTCFSVRGHGIQCLDAKGGLKTYNRSSGLTTTSIRDMAVCGGKILAAGSRAVHIFDGQQWTINALPKGWANRIACGSGKAYVASSSSTISVWNGSGWKFYISKAILANEKHKSFNDSALAKDGSVWFVAFGGIAGRISPDGTAKIWKDQAGLPFRTVLSRIFINTKGKVIIPTIRGLLSWNGQDWKLIAGPGYGNPSEAADGTVWFSSGTRIRRFKDGAWTAMRAKWSTRSVAADPSGRLWVASEFGLGVMKDGKWEWRQMHNSTLADNGLRTVVVLGNGGNLPKLQKPKNGTLKGRMEWRKGGEPVANIPVQICGISRGFFSKSPCVNQPLHREAKTDKDGMFVFEDVAPSSYRIVAKPGSKWVRIFLGYNRARVQAGKSKNTGTIKISDRFRK